MKRYIPVILLALGCVVVFGFNLEDLSLNKGDENYYFSSAMRMIREGDYITPRYHHHIRFEKPALYYWIVALFIKFFGASWGAARMTSVLFAVLTVLITYLFSLRFFPKKTALLTGFMLATSLLFFLYARLAVIDMTLLFLLTLAFYLFIKAEQDKKRLYFLLSYAAVGLSVLAKGPLGLLIFAVVVAAYIIRTKKYKLLKDMNVPAGIAIILVISLPWPLLMYKIHGGEYINHIWETEAVDKTVGSISKIENIENLPGFALNYIGYYVPVVLFSFAPWSLFLPFGLFKKLRTGKKDDGAFISSWFWAVFIFFTIVSFKHTHYMLLISPALCMIVANIFSKKRVGIVWAVAVITAMIYISLTGAILPALNDNALRSFSLMLTAEMDTQDQEVGIASREFNLKRLGLYLNNLVSSPYDLSADDLAQYKLVKKEAKLLPFLQSRERVFCLITAADYERLVPANMRDGLFIIDRALMWKKIKFKNAVPYIMSNDLGGLKEEAYLISNRRQ